MHQWIGIRQTNWLPDYLLLSLWRPQNVTILSASSDTNFTKMSTDSICWLRVKADPIEQIRYCPDVAIHFKYCFFITVSIHIHSVFTLQLQGYSKLQTQNWYCAVECIDFKILGKQRALLLGLGIGIGRYPKLKYHIEKGKSDRSIIKPAFIWSAVW